MGKKVWEVKTAKLSEYAYNLWSQICGMDATKLQN